MFKVFNCRENILFGLVVFRQPVQQQGKESGRNVRVTSSGAKVKRTQGYLSVRHCLHFSSSNTCRVSGLRLLYLYTVREKLKWSKESSALNPVFYLSV